MVDARRVHRLLQRVSENLGYLAARAALDRQLVRDDPDRLAGVKYVFVVTIEGCLDVAQHLCASEGWGPPSSNAGAMRVLGAHQVLAPELVEAMARAIGFRNVLVHGYAEVDDDLVISYLDRLGPLDAFVAAISAWVTASSG